MSSTRSSHVKERLDALGLVEDEEYSLLQDILQQWKGARGTKHVKDRLDALGLVEDEEYSELQDILQLRPQGGNFD
jgi:Fe2+ transport system protein FeoA